MLTAQLCYRRPILYGLRLLVHPVPNQCSLVRQYSTTEVVIRQVLWLRDYPF